MRWATRPRCHVDRTACAWLIRRFVDPDAEFVFSDELVDVPDDATPFDMRGAELSHRDGDCSFERFLAEYDLRDSALERIARIVHEATSATIASRHRRHPESTSPYGLSRPGATISSCSG